MKEVQAFRCDHCHKLYRNAKVCKRHEETLCLKNPMLQPLCYHCKHYRYACGATEIVTIYFDTPFGSCERQKEFDKHKCGKREGVKLFNNIKLDDDTQEALYEADFDAMPRPKDGCEFYEAEEWYNPN